MVYIALNLIKLKFKKKEQNLYMIVNKQYA